MITSTNNGCSQMPITTDQLTPSGASSYIQLAADMNEAGTMEREGSSVHGGNCPDGQHLEFQNGKQCLVASMEG